LLSRLAELRARTARPHWLVADEAHHLMPQARDAAGTMLANALGALLLITVHADLLNQAATSSINAAVAVGAEPRETIEGFAASAGLARPRIPEVDLEPGQGIFWLPAKHQDPFRVGMVPPRSEHNRHHRKYAEGTLGEDRSFFFRGPDNLLNLKAVNLMRFVELAEGVDDETWLHHLHRKDYSGWFREGIKDAGLAAEAERVEADKTLGSAESRSKIIEAVEAAYTLPADEESGTRTD